MSDEPVLEIDTLGKRCPVPVIELAKQLPQVGVGEVVAVITDDAAASVDIPVWCRMKGQEYAGSHPRDAGTVHLVRRLA